MVWPGQEEKRIIRGIQKILPTELYFLLESRTPDWIKFQEESLKNISNYFGKLYELNKNAHKIIFQLNGFPPEDHSKIIFSKIHEVISNIRKTHPEAKIFLDSTAVPKPIFLVFTFVAMTLSNDKSEIQLQSVPKASRLGPIYYASDDSEYYKTHVNDKNNVDKIDEYLLSKYRTKEKNDPGDEPIEIKLPHNNFAILNPKVKEDFKLLSLFSVLPNNKQAPITSKEIAEKLYSKNTVLFKRKTDPNETDRAFMIWIGKNLEKLRELGLIILERPHKSLIAKKAWGGDLISGATDELYAENMPKFLTNDPRSQINKCPKCANPMHETKFDSWEGDTDGDFPRYITKYECLKCGYNSEIE